MYPLCSLIGTLLPNFLWVQLHPVFASIEKRAMFDSLHLTLRWSNHAQTYRIHSLYVTGAFWSAGSIASDILLNVLLVLFAYFVFFLESRRVCIRILLHYVGVVCCLFLYFSLVHYIYTNHSTYFVSPYRANYPPKRGPRVAVPPISSTKIPTPTIMATRPPLDPLVQSMPSAPTQASHQRMSFTQPPASSSLTIPTLSSGLRNSGVRPFPPGNYCHDGPHSMNHRHQPYFLINSARMSVRNPYAKVNTGQGRPTFTPQLTTTPTYMQHHSTTYPQSRRIPLHELASEGLSELFPKAPFQFPSIPNRNLQARTLKTPSTDSDSPFALVPSQHDPSEYEPNILYGPLSSSSSDSEDTGPMIDLQAIPVEPEKPITPSVSTFITAADVIANTTSSIEDRNDVSSESFVVDATSRATSPRRPQLQDPPPVMPPTLPVNPPPATVSFSTADLARFVLRSDNLYGTVDITTSTRDLSGVSSRHSKRCGDLLTNIFDLLASHPSPEMQYLAQDVSDPDSGLMTKQFWVHLSGEPTEAKKQLLNAILIIFSHWYRKVEYRSSSIADMTAQEVADVSC
jgi:hypothetical protein